MQKPNLKVRRATILDTVNLYRLLADYEKQKNTGVPQDDAARMAHVLHTLTTGFVLVVERAGRLLGSAGFGAGGPGYALQQSLVSQWHVLPNGLGQNYRLLEAITRDVVSFADEHKVAVMFATAAEPNDKLDAVLEHNGFRVRSILFERSPTLEQVDEDPIEPESDPDLDEWDPGEADGDSPVVLGAPTAARPVPAATAAEPAVYSGEGVPSEATEV